MLVSLWSFFFRELSLCSCRATESTQNKSHDWEAATNVRGDELQGINAGGPLAQINAGNGLELSLIMTAL